MRVPDAIHPATFIFLVAVTLSWTTTSVLANDATACVSAKSPDTKITVCGRAIRSGIVHGQNLAILYNHRCHAYYEIADYDSALDDCNAAVRLLPGNAAVLGGRGAVYLGKRDHDRALRDIMEAIRLDPKQLNAHNNLSLAYALKGDFERAIEIANEIIRLHPRYAYAYKNRGLALEGLGRLDEALSDFRLAVRLEPAVLDAREGIRRIEQRQSGIATTAVTGAATPAVVPTAAMPQEFDNCFGRHESAAKLKACADLITSGKLHGRELALAYGERGSIYSQVRNFDAAIAEFNEALKLERGIAELFHHRAAALLQSGAHQSAINDLNEAIKLNPRDAQAFFNRGVAKLNAGNTVGGNADIAEAKRLNPQLTN